ncbi:hypothetical protein PQG02_07785 [Nostoc sp. UHCC 0926]|uniref:hypothetical protein n=1 Tax=unclassified Nostoc TaxID=2593658 RepID=UPI00235EF3A8|nr:hypothetical protein [Nostoc sp. UHCC 0926]WDD34225.1 hypothetical protein PQG02_07785 [Nostoc sp. UHCC 0926]
MAHQKKAFLGNFRSNSNFIVFARSYLAEMLNNVTVDRTNNLKMPVFRHVH